jgi:hypothetical protein
MSESVDDPWRSNVDVRDMSDTDFERRSDTISLYNREGHIESLLESLSEVYDLSIAEAADRAVRLYLAHLMDTDQISADLREKYDVTALVPPRGWVKDFEPVGIETTTDEGRDVISVSLPPTVKEMIEDVGDSDDMEELRNNSNVAVAAIKWVAGDE